jgi:hypothetical protein
MRVWVVQEILSNANAFVHCGKFGVDLDLLLLVGRTAVGAAKTISNLCMLSRTTNELP